MSRDPSPIDERPLALLVDDDIELGELLQDALDEHGIRRRRSHEGGPSVGPAGGGP